MLSFYPYYTYFPVCIFLLPVCLFVCLLPSVFVTNKRLDVYIKQSRSISAFLPERDYVMFGSLLSQICLSACLSFVVCLSVTFVHPTQGVEAFGNISSRLCTLAIDWPPYKILRRCLKGIPPSQALNARGIAKYSDFGTVDGFSVVNSIEMR